MRKGIVLADSVAGVYAFIAAAVGMALPRVEAMTFRLLQREKAFA